MGRQSAKDAYLAILEASEGKTKAQAQTDTLGLIDIIADLIEASGTKTTVSTAVTGTLPSGPVAATGAQVDAPGTIEVPA